MLETKVGPTSASPTHRPRGPSGAGGLVHGGLVVVLGASLAACGPIYLHDPAGEAAANAARTQFQESLEKARLSELVANYRAQNAEQAAATKTLQQDDVRNQIFALSAKKWPDLLSDTKTELGNTKTAVGEAQTNLKQLDDALTSALQASEAANQRVGGLVEALNRAAAAELRYAASQKLLAAGLQSVLSQGTNDGNATLEAALKTKVKGRSFKLDAGGNLVETAEEKTVGAVLGIDSAIAKSINRDDPVGSLETLLNGAKGLESFKGLQLGSPGIAVTVVGLGYDVARAEERRLATTMDEVRRTRNLYREQLPFLVDQQKRLQGNLTQLQSLDKSLRGHPDAKVNLDTATVEDIVRRLRTLAADTANATEQREWRARLITLYRQLGDNVQFRVVDAQARDNLENALTVFQAERALAIAEINLREREAVILRGLDGLVAFHQGGIDADDVRNLIMLAQAFGIIAIAAK
jgi:hypothetical protein